MAALASLPAVARGVTPNFSRTQLDYFQGPLVNDTRVIGLGGAYVSLAEGVAGHAVNPAAYAVRTAAFANDWFDWDVGVSTLHVVGDDNDLDMSGNDATGDASQAQQVGANLKFGRFGIGVQFAQLNHTLAVGSAEDGTFATWQLSKSYGGVGLAWALRDGEWVVGTLIGGGQATLKSPHPDQPIVHFATEFFPSTFGVLWAPHGERYRFGASFRLPLRMTQALSDDTAGPPVQQLGPLTVPQSVYMAGELVLGASYMMGARQPNIRPSYGKRPLPPGAVRGRHLRRQYTLVSADLVITGAVPQGIGPRSYLDGQLQQSGRSASVGLRAGAESEVIDNRLQIRMGTYFEPSRFDDRIGRPHITAGLDVRVTAYWDWRITAVADLASDYSNVSAGIGLWH